MFRLMVGLLLLFQIAYTQDKYFIQLGSFKQLNLLESNIQRLPVALRSHVIIVELNSWYIPFAYHVENKSILYPQVSKYKRYFPDAFINHASSMLLHPIIRNYTQSPIEQKTYTPRVAVKAMTTPPEHYQNVAISEEDNTLNLPVRAVVTPSPSVALSNENVAVQPVRKSHVQLGAVDDISSAQSTTSVEPIRYKYFNTKMLSGNSYYLTYKSPEGSPDLLIKVTFGTHRVTYQPVTGEMRMTKANYLVDDNRLYMFTDGFTRDGAYSILDEHRPDHFLVSSWTNGKKLNTLRYYYHLNDAKKYLGLKTSEGLANVLEEGDFDELYIED